MSNGNSATWIDDGEKYAVVGLTVKVDGHTPSGTIASDLWVLADTTFNTPPYWREWLGSIRAREVEDCNLFLLSKLRHGRVLPTWAYRRHRGADYLILSITLC
jgi:hypothetical protein